MSQSKWIGCFPCRNSRTPTSSISWFCHLLGTLSPLGRKATSSQELKEDRARGYQGSGNFHCSALVSPELHSVERPHLTVKGEGECRLLAGSGGLGKTWVSMKLHSMSRDFCFRCINLGAIVGGKKHRV